MSASVQCIGSTSAIANTGDLAADCATAGGSMGWVESVGGLPELSLTDGGLIAGAMLALWAVAWSFRVLKKQIEES